MLCLCKIYSKKCLVQHVLPEKSTQPEPVLAATQHTCPLPKARFWAGISSCHPAADCHNLTLLHDTFPCPGWRVKRCQGTSELLTFPHENEDFWVLYLSGPGGNTGNLKRGDWGGLAALSPLLLCFQISFPWRKMTAVVGNGCSGQQAPGVCLPHVCWLRDPAGCNREGLVALAQGLCREGFVSLLWLRLTRCLSTERAQGCCLHHCIFSGLDTVVSRWPCCLAEHPMVRVNILPFARFH